MSMRFITLASEAEYADEDYIEESDRKRRRDERSG
jgi:hypothetical protein